MDTNFLVESLYESGKVLIEKLDAQGYKFPIALWINDQERNGWTLFFAVPDLKILGSKSVFKRIYDVIIKNNLDISLNNISLIDTHNELCLSLKRMINTGPKIGKIMFFGNTINGRRFPDSIIYRVQ